MKFLTFNRDDFAFTRLRRVRVDTIFVLLCKVYLEHGNCKNTNKTMFINRLLVNFILMQPKLPESFEMCLLSTSSLNLPYFHDTNLSLLFQV